MSGAVVANSPLEGEGGEARGEASACGERESTAVEEAVDVGDFSGDG